MDLSVPLDDEAAALLAEMADEGGVTLDLIVQIAIYNLIAVWADERDRLRAQEDDFPSKGDH